MRRVEVHQVDAFTEEVFGGNPAGVVTNADQLSDEEMQKVAREMNLSETAFVLTSSVEQADMRLRYFTPDSEVDFCGHATVGTLFELARLAMFGLGEPGENHLQVETNAGILPMIVTNEATPIVTFTAPAVSLEPYMSQGEEFAGKIGVPLELIDPSGTIYRDQNLNYLYIPATSLRALGAQDFDYSRMRAEFGAEEIVVFCFYSKETVDEHADLHARGLAPNVGINEDPFTGSMQAGLVKSAKENGFIKNDQQHIRTEQGHFMGRPGSAIVDHDIATDVIAVSAHAAHVFSTEMEF